MAIRSGLAAQLGLAAESTWGTAATPNRWFEFTDESLALTIERIESEGLRATNRVLRSDRYAVGNKAVEADLVLTLRPKTRGCCSSTPSVLTRRLTRQERFTRTPPLSVTRMPSD